jgi:WD domain, G-beta repeat
MQTWLISIRCFWSGAILLAALPCIAAEPTTRPLPRLATGMHTAGIERIATDAAGRWAVTASADKTARVWEVASGRQLAVLRPPQDVGNEGKFFAVALSPDGAVVAVGGYTAVGCCVACPDYHHPFTTSPSHPMAAGWRRAFMEPMVYASSKPCAARRPGAMWPTETVPLV